MRKCCLISYQIIHLMWCCSLSNINFATLSQLVRLVSGVRFNAPLRIKYVFPWLGKSVHIRIWSFYYFLSLLLRPKRCKYASIISTLLRISPLAADRFMYVCTAATCLDPFSFFSINLFVVWRVFPHSFSHSQSNIKFNQMWWSAHRPNGANERNRHGELRRTREAIGWSPLRIGRVCGCLCVLILRLRIFTTFMAVMTFYWRIWYTHDIQAR